MDSVSIIRKKRNNQPLSDLEIRWFVEQYTTGAIPDYQASALLMAGFLNGFSTEETVSLTRAMLESGKVLAFPNLPGRKVDKHSTGGVGDKLSLLLAPIVASCGVFVPMVSGRGLGHTGGTLDKLESIPGFNVNLKLDDFTAVLQKTGAGLIGQTPEIAPADRKLYALRDVTATVESIPFITASIMSKKIAEGIDALVLDVKSGSGAFMKTDEEALALAKSLVDTGTGYGKDVVAFITDMSSPLGFTAGNWIEVEEAWNGLNGRGPDDVMQLTHLLAGAMIWLGKRASSLEEGLEQSKLAVSSGKAAEKWLEMVTAQGGDTTVFFEPGFHSPNEKSIVTSPANGFIAAADTFQLGMATVAAGAGRFKKEDPVDPHAGIRFFKKPGKPVKKGETIAEVYAKDAAALRQSLALVEHAFSFSDSQPSVPKAVRYIVDASGVKPFTI